MDYVQTVMFRIAAGRMDEALSRDGLLGELDRHREELQGRPGFRGARITRSANPEGDVLVVFETHWADNNSLADYEANEPNAASIVRKHQDLIIAGSLQVERMESVAEGAAGGEPEPVYNRLALALLVPLGVLAFALLVIYSLSRIYLEVSSEAATIIAAIVAVAILGFSWYFATNPRVPQWQIAGLAGVVVLALSAGGIYAAVEQADEEPEAHASPTPGDGNGPPPETVLIMDDNVFIYGGEENPTIPVPASQDVSLDLRNDGTAVHNVHVSLTGEFEENLCEGETEEPCSEPSSIDGGETGVLEFNLPAGSYDYRCDFHPVEMTGTFEAS
jgi:heme-degrading monooxygenase HmoA